jgi:glycosyltransferase involved in cell wall biosynthesis
MSLNIWYVNHYASRPGTGRGERPLNLARAMTARGHRITIVAAARHHLQFPEAPPAKGDEIADTGGVRLLPMAVCGYRKNGFSRLVNMLDFSRGTTRIARWVRFGQLASPDVIVYSSPHPMAFPAFHRLARRLGVPIVFEERDLWPISLVELAGVWRFHPLVLWMDRIVKRAYRTSNAVVSLLPLALSYMEDMGLSPDRFHYIPNGVSAADWRQSPEPLPAHHQTAYDRCREAGKLVVSYTGAHGPPNALDQILDLGGVDRGPRPYHFVLIGDGTEKPALQQRVAREGLDFVTLLPSIPKAAVRSALACSDACFISLKDSPVFRFGVSPNKLFDYFMAARPVIYAIRSGNRPVEEAGAGLAVSPYDPGELDEALRALATMSPEQRRTMGLRGREFVLAHHEWTGLGKRYVDLCQRLTRQVAPRPSRRAA